jgi:LCP family protein required for cell wall assembly
MEKIRKLLSNKNFYIFASLLIIVSLIVGGVTFTFFKGLTAPVDTPQSTLDSFTPSGSAESTSQPTPADDDTILDPLPAPKWDGKSRVTMLVMGLDYRDWSGGADYNRTDTMMLLTIDPTTMTAGALSIPRDLWANIPGFQPQKINTAYYFGELYKYPGGGPALAMKTVENTIGVPIDYYAQIDFYTFMDFIDLIGGVRVEVPYTIELEVIDKQKDIILTPGVYVLGGPAALAYARNRYTGGGDFERAARQQQIIMGIRDRLLEPGTLLTLIENADELYRKFSTGIRTNLPLEDAINLALLAVQIKSEDITMRVITEDACIYGTSPDDLSILIPIPDKVRAIRDEVFSSAGPFTPFMSGDAQTLMQLEGARISILNATSDSTLGDRTAEYLRGLGANVVSVGFTDVPNGQNSITDFTGKPYTLAYLVPILNIPEYRVYQSYDPASTIDIQIVLGNEWIYNNPMP